MWKKITDDLSRHRNRLEIYHEILTAIDDELTKRESASIPVRYMSNMSGDKLSNYLEILEKKGLLQKIPLSLTKKGKLFLRDYDKIVALLKQWDIYQELEC